MRRVALIDLKAIMRFDARLVALSKRNGNSHRTNSALTGRCHRRRENASDARHDKRSRGNERVDHSGR